MKRSWQLQLNRIEARIPYDSLKRAESKQAYHEFLTQSKPETWEWILDLDPREVEEATSLSQREIDERNTAMFLALSLAMTRGWRSNNIHYVGQTDIHWIFSLQASFLGPEKEQNWPLLYLMGLTPAQFKKEIPLEKRENVLAEARKRVENRFQEFGQEKVNSLRHPNELFQAIRELNLPELYKIPG